MRNDYPVFPDGPERPYYLKCHKCGRREPLTHREYQFDRFPAACPTCGAPDYQRFGPTASHQLKGFLRDLLRVFGYNRD